MREEDVKVKTGGKVVATVAVPVYESVAEAVETETEAVVLKKFNSQNATDLANIERAKHRPATMGKAAQVAAKRVAATNICTTEEIMNALGNADVDFNGDKAAAIDALVNSDEIQARLAAQAEEAAG